MWLKGVFWFLVVFDLLLTVLLLISPTPDIPIDDISFDFAFGMLILSIVSMIFYFVGILGLLCFKKWGRIAYVLSYLTILPGILIFSLSISHLFMTTLEKIGFVVGVVILLLAFLPPLRKEFE